jgi:hypothetical protein
LVAQGCKVVQNEAESRKENVQELESWLGMNQTQINEFRRCIGKAKDYGETVKRLIDLEMPTVAKRNAKLAVRWYFKALAVRKAAKKAKRAARGL